MKVFVTRYIYIGIHYWQAANAWSAMALHDRAAGTKTNQAKVVNGLKAAFKAQKGNNYDKDGYAICSSNLQTHWC